MMPPEHRLARALLLFFRHGPWTDADCALWRSLTGSEEVTTKVLCDLARSMLPPPVILPGWVTDVLAAKRVSTLSPVHRRLIETSDRDDLAFQHTVLCQTSLPYRDPGDNVRLWERGHGNATLQVQAGHIANPGTQTMVPIGLPWGTKPRLILAHLNAEALRHRSPVLEVEGSLSAFVKRIRGFGGGREIRMFKDQLARLSASNVRLAIFHENHALQVNSQIITAFELWLEKDERQRALWPSTIKLSPEYFASLQAHAVPLYEADLAALAHPPRRSTSMRGWRSGCIGWRRRNPHSSPGRRSKSSLVPTMFA
jgi:hypothetical protein